MRAPIFLLLAMIASGCDSNPESMRLTNPRIELVQSKQYYPNRRIGELALALAFEGKSPFAAVVNEGKQAQFRCYLIGSTGKPLSETEFGRTYFDAPATAENQRDGRVMVTGEEQYRYKAILYPGLRAHTDVNGPPNIDLDGDSYDHIQCQLVGVQMFGGFMYSNLISIPAADVRELVGMRRKAASTK